MIVDPADKSQDPDAGCNDGLVTTTVVYTDGACSGNPGPGGWAWVVPGGEHDSGSEPSTTNQRMELRAALEAITTLPRPLEVFSDSTYLVNCFRDGWWRGWLQRDWVNSQKKPVANRDLWEPIIAEFQKGHISFRWVRGHAGDRWNDEADKLAVAAAQRAALATPAPTSAPPSLLPDGHRIWVGGHRPADLGGHEENLTSGFIRTRLAEILWAKAGMHPDLIVVSGLNLGAETLGAEAALDSGVRLAVVLAYPDFDRLWPEPARLRFSRLLDRAEAVIVRQKQPPTSRQQAGASLARRDSWARKEVDEALIVWNGLPGPIEGQVAAWRQALGEEEVWVVDAP
jgi:ribonuclease HI